MKKQVMLIHRNKWPNLKQEVKTLSEILRAFIRASDTSPGKQPAADPHFSFSALGVGKKARRQCTILK
jgi:hypothetical protein